MPKFTVALLLCALMLSAAALAHSFRVGQRIEGLEKQPAVISEQSVVVDAIEHSLGHPNSDPKSAKGGKYAKVDLMSGDILEFTVGRQGYTIGVGQKDWETNADGPLSNSAVVSYKGYFGRYGCLVISIGQEILHLPTGVTKLIIGEGMSRDGVRFYIFDVNHVDNGGSVLVNVRQLRPGT